MSEKNDQSKIPSQHIDKISRILLMLDNAQKPQDLNLPVFQLQKLTGKHKGHMAMKVSKNWRITFRFVGTDVADVDLVNYIEQGNEKCL